MPRPDLHTHTTASDGVLTPRQVVLRAKQNGVDLLAVSDHDTLGGLAQARAAAEENGIAFIPAVEISAGGEDEIHVLGYCVHADMPELSALLAAMQAERLERAQGIVRKLNALGMKIDYSEVPVASNGVAGRPQIARVMIAHGYVKDMAEAFERYLGRGCPAYVARKKIAVSDVIALLKREGAVPVLAHPGLIRMDAEAFNAHLDAWIQAGLMGLEAYHPEHLPGAFTRWDRCARERGLLVTGGSDYHDAEPRHGDIGVMLPYWTTCDQDGKALLEAVRKARKA